MRYRLKLGGSRLKCNKGVAQGSVISPALFDIYIEDLSLKLQEQEINLEDILLYADDMLVLCTSPHQVEACIKTIERWSSENGMKLNKDKSGIVVFGNRKSRQIPMMLSRKDQEQKEEKNNKIVWSPGQKSILGVPLCTKYKYLGTWLDNKLTCGPQINYIKKKAAHLFTKLFPYLSHASADGRRDMWQTMVAPLFNAALVLLEFEPSECHRANLERLKRVTFKRFLMISKRTNTILVDDMIRKNLAEHASEVVKTSRLQWEQRKIRTEVTALLPDMRETNGLRGVPGNFCELVSVQTRVCHRCGDKNKISNAWHMKYIHGADVQHVNRIWRNEILPITEDKTIKRERVAKITDTIIKRHLMSYQKNL